MQQTMKLFETTMGNVNPKLFETTMQNMTLFETTLNNVHLKLFETTMQKHETG